MSARAVVWWWNGTNTIHQADRRSGRWAGTPKNACAVVWSVFLYLVSDETLTSTQVVCHCALFLWVQIATINLFLYYPFLQSAHFYLMSQEKMEGSDFFSLSRSSLLHWLCVSYILVVAVLHHCYPPFSQCWPGSYSAPRLEQIINPLALIVWETGASRRVGSREALWWEAGASQITLFEMNSAKILMSLSLTFANSNY